MTVRLYRKIIGSAWGKPQGATGPEHYYFPVFFSETRDEWQSACSRQRIRSEDHFAGIGLLALTFENNPLEADRCPECLDSYGKTAYGTEYGVQSPGWTPTDGEIYPSQEIA